MSYGIKDIGRINKISDRIKPFIQIDVSNRVMYSIKNTAILFFFLTIILLHTKTVSAQPYLQPVTLENILFLNAWKAELKSYRNHPEQLEYSAFQYKLFAKKKVRRIVVLAQDTLMVLSFDKKGHILQAKKDKVKYTYTYTNNFRNIVLTGVDSEGRKSYRSYYFNKAYLLDSVIFISDRDLKGSKQLFEYDNKNRILKQSDDVHNYEYVVDTCVNIRDVYKHILNGFDDSLRNMVESVSDNYFTSDCDSVVIKKFKSFCCSDVDVRYSPQTKYILYNHSEVGSFYDAYSNHDYGSNLQWISYYNQRANQYVFICRDFKSAGHFDISLDINVRVRIVDFSNKIFVDLGSWQHGDAADIGTSEGFNISSYNYKAKWSKKGLPTELSDNFGHIVRYLYE